MLNQKGFTLIEVLLASMIFSVLIGIAAWGYGQYIDVWEKQLFSDVPEMSDYRRLALMRRSIEGCFDYYVKSAKSDFMAPFFEGEKSRFTFVTRCPVFSDAPVALARITLKEEANLHALLYEEENLKGTYLTNATHNMKGEHGLVVMKDISGFEISYFGLSSEGLTAQELMAEEDLRTYQWSPDFSGDIRGLLPAKVDMQIRKGGETYRFLFHMGEGAREKWVTFNNERLLKWEQ